MLGSSWFVKHPPPGVAPADIVAMLNMDMVGRLRKNSLKVFGTDTATEWPDMLGAACDAARVDCVRDAGGGFGASDQLFLLRRRRAGASLLLGRALRLPQAERHGGQAQRRRHGAGRGDRRPRSARRRRPPAKLQYQRVASPPPRGDVRGFGSSLGTVPDYAGPPNGQKGMLLAGVDREALPTRPG